MELTPLDETQVIALIDQLTSDAEQPASGISHTIATLAQGNPYHAEMLLTDWRQHAGRSLAAAESTGTPTVAAWQPPETLRLALVRQYKGLSADAQHVLQILSVAQKALLTQAIATLLRIDPTPIERSILELVERGFVRVEGARFAFKNELHRAYVYYAMAVDARRYYHARLGQASWENRDEGDFQWAIEASHHFIRSGMMQEGVAAAILGAELALARGAPHEASRALHTLLQAHPQEVEPRVHLLLARAHLSGGNYRATLEAIARYVGTNANGAHDGLAAMLRAEALHRGCLGEGRTVIEAAQVAVRLAEGAGAEETLARALQVLAEAAVDMGEFQVLAQVREAASELAAQTDRSECRALAGVTRGFAAVATGEFRTGSKILGETAKLLEKLSLHPEYRRVLNGLGLCWTGLGHFSEAASAFERAIVVAQRLGDTTSVSFGWNNLLALYNDFGMFQQAVKASRRALDSLDASSTRVTPSLYANVATLAIQLGNLCEAELFCQECERGAAASRRLDHTVTALLERADLCLARSTPELAWPLVEEALLLANGRERTLSDMGQFHRLRTHFLWATKGYESVRPHILQGATGRCSRKVDILEVQAFDAWVMYSEGDGSRESIASTISEIESSSMIGVLARLFSVGARLPGFPERADGESSAQLVVRLFPALERAAVPTAVGLAGPTA